MGDCSLGGLFAASLKLQPKDDTLATSMCQGLKSTSLWCLWTHPNPHDDSQAELNNFKDTHCIYQWECSQETHTMSLNRKNLIQGTSHEVLEELKVWQWSKGSRRAHLLLDLQALREAMVSSNPRGWGSWKWEQAPHRMSWNNEGDLANSGDATLKQKGRVQGRQRP